jgi:signal transduction histidine kinase
VESKLKLSEEVLNIPIGVYSVKMDGDFVSCNNIARRMFDIPLNEPLIANIIDYYYNPDDRSLFLQQLYNSHNQNGHLAQELLHFKVSGKSLYVEVCAKLIFEDEHPIGLIGCIYDVTKRYEEYKEKNPYAEKFSILTHDIGAMLHEVATVLTTTSITMKKVMRAMTLIYGKNLDFEKKDPFERVFENADLLLRNLNSLVENYEKNEHSRGVFSDEQWKIINLERKIISQTLSNEDIIQQKRPVLYDAALSVLEQQLSANSGHVPREILREIREKSQLLTISAALIPLNESISKIIQMDQTVVALRHYVTTDVQVRDPKVSVNVRKLIDEGINEVTEFAHNQNIRLRIDFKKANIFVIGVHSDLLRAISNILHNAIKYSWKDNDVRVLFREIKSGQSNSIEISVINKGVAITKEELKELRVFEMGYRGEYSHDRSRSGTGIGLSDALNVIRLHEGDLHINSHPTFVINLTPEDSGYYKSLFSTKVTIRLPIHEVQGKL